MSDTVDRARNQGIWLAIGQVGARAAQLLSTIALARLLVPEHFGKVAVAAVVWEVIALFGNTGVAATLVQRRDLDGDLLDAAFWLNGSVALVVAGASVGVSLAAARFYDEPAIVPVIALYALAFVISSAGSIHAVLLTREVSFGRIALVDTSAAVLSAALSVALAAAGFGFWSLVLHAPAIAIFRSALLWRLHPFRPRLRLRLDRWREIFGYGRYVLGAELAGYVSLNGDYMITGKVLGQAPLGIYSMAYRVANWPVEAGVWLVSRIALPTLSGLQETPGRLAEIFTKMLRAVAFLAFPAVALLFATAPDLVGALFGAEKWGESGPLIRILLPFVLVRTIGSPAAQVLLAVGRARESFVFAASVTPVLLAAVLLGTKFGITGVAVATSLVLGLAAAILTGLSCRAARAPIGDVVAALGPGMALGAVALAASWAGLSIAPSIAGMIAPRLAALIAPEMAPAILRAWRLALAATLGSAATFAVGFLFFPEERRLVLRAVGDLSPRERLRQFRRGVMASILGRGGEV